jgi:hypothetical protein
MSMSHGVIDAPTIAARKPVTPSVFRPLLAFLQVIVEAVAILLMVIAFIIYAIAAGICWLAAKLWEAAVRLL